MAQLRRSHLASCYDDGNNLPGEYYEVQGGYTRVVVGVSEAQGRVGTSFPAEHDIASGPRR